MHLLRLFLTAWLALGTVTVSFLFWLCERTAQRINRFDKPVLDQAAFQQPLASASTLQAQKNRKLGKETQADSSPIVSLPVESVPMTQSDLEPSASLKDLAVPNYADRRIAGSDEFFWKVATATAMVAVFALLLVGSIDHFSPLPAGLVVVQKQEPSRRVVFTKAIVEQPQAARIRPNQRKVFAHKRGRSTAVLAQKTIMNRTRHSVYASEADLVAPDTVMHYGRRRSQ